MSGSFKATTISSEANKLITPPAIVWSMIKSWKYAESNIFSNLTSPDHLNFAMLHLCTLETIVKCSPGVQNILVERGVTDAIFYWLRNNVSAGADNSWISEAVNRELQIVSGFEVEKVLLIMKDREFIENIVLKEPSRRLAFPLGVDSYLEDQNKYVDFTCRWNNITEVEEITSAQDYIKKLGLNYII